MSETPQSQLMKAFCNECVRESNHRILAKHDYRQDADDESGICVFNEYLTVQCAGCDHIYFLHRSLCSEDIWHDEDGDYYEWNAIEYPPRQARPFPIWFGEIDNNLRHILFESYAALKNGLPILATMGARAALERLMLLKIDDKGRFAANVDAFIEMGYMQRNLKQPLIDALDAGHAATHRAYAPTNEVLSSVFDVLEGIINATLILPDRAQNVQKVTPPRIKKSKTEETQ